MTDLSVLPVIVRVLEASGPTGEASLVVSGGLDVTEVAEQVASGGGHGSLVDGRLHVRVPVDHLVAAAGRVGGADLAQPVEAAVRAAVGAWRDGPRDLPTRAGTLPTSRRPVVMGIVNVTPDSFSDGGDHDTAEAAIAHGRRLRAEGADVLDVGGESTRPGADPVAEDEELRRVVPVVQALADDGAVVSIDTSKAAVAEAAVGAGAAIVNDVSAGTADERMLELVAELGVPYVAMHAQGTPRDMQEDPTYGDVVAEVFEELHATARRCAEAGIAPDCIVLDPGIGFGKTVTHNLELLRCLRQFRSLGQPLLLGASRKSFLGAVTGVGEAAERLAGSLAAAVIAAQAGAAILRVHDVAPTVEALRVASAVAVGEPVAWETTDDRGGS